MGPTPAQNPTGPIFRGPQIKPSMPSRMARHPIKKAPGIERLKHPGDSQPKRLGHSRNAYYAYVVLGRLYGWCRIDKKGHITLTTNTALAFHNL